jgi:hypothetical protein
MAPKAARVSHGLPWPLAFEGGMQKDPTLFWGPIFWSRRLKGDLPLGKILAQAARFFPIGNDD